MLDCVCALTKLPLLLAATAVSAVLAQPALGPAPPQEARQNVPASSAAALTRQNLLECVELEDGIETRKTAHDAQVAELNKEVDAVNAETRSVEEAQKLAKRADNAAVATLARRVEAVNLRVAAVNTNTDRLRTLEAQMATEVTRYNASCASRPYDPRDKQAALTDFQNRKAAAAAAGPFEAGLMAFEQGKHQEALALWLPLAEQGRANSQFNIAVMYEQGLGVARSEVEATRWYLAAAERGVVTAQLKVGTLYEAGVGVAKDLSSASYWYGEAAKGTGKDSDEARQARERLAGLPKEYRAGPEDVVAFEGGRFVLRRAANKQCVIALQGAITPSANFEFEGMLKKARAQGCARPLVLLLESPGGSVDAGLALARSVHDEGMRTIARYECASSCATIFLGGTERVLWGARAAIGLHQVALVKQIATYEDSVCVGSSHDPSVVSMRRFLRLVVPETADEIFRIVMNTPCKTIEWVNGKRALDLQIATRLEAEGQDVFGPREERLNATATAPR